MSSSQFAILRLIEREGDRGFGGERGAFGAQAFAQARRKALVQERGEAVVRRRLGVLARIAEPKQRGVGVTAEASCAREITRER